MSAETIARPAVAAEAPKPTAFTDAEHSMLDAMNVPANRQGRALLFREMQRTGLDPFAKHLYLREDWNKSANKNVYAVASTIDGFRIVAARQSTYEGQTAPQWCDKNGNWSDAWYADAPPVAARIGVYVRGYREPMWGIARFNEYRPNGNGGFMWAKMPALMIAKVAEALAIRKAYPDQLSGVYTDDEMQQADARNDEKAADAQGGGRRAQRSNKPADDEWNTATGEPLAPPAVTMPTVTGEQLGELARLLKLKRGAVNGDRNRIISELVRRPVADVQTLSQAEARSIIETLTAEPDRTPPTTDATPAAPGTPDNPVIGKNAHRQMQALFKEAGILDRDAQHAFIQRVLRLDEPLKSRNDITPEQFKTIRHALSTGEVPPGPNANGEGVSEFDVLNQMIWDVNSDETHNEVQQAITVEVGRDTISATDAGILRERLAAHVKQAKAAAA